MIGRIEEQPPTSVERKGVQLPTVSPTLKRWLLTVIGAVCLVIFLCSLPIWVLGWLGWNTINHTDPTPTVHPAQVITQPVAPIQCGPDEWVMRWRGADGEHFACTPKW